MIKFTKSQVRDLTNLGFWDSFNEPTDPEKRKNRIFESDRRIGMWIKKELSNLFYITYIDNSNDKFNIRLQVEIWDWDNVIEYIRSIK